MKHRGWTLLGLGATLMLAGAVAVAEDAPVKKRYRYTREDGSVVLDFSVPPQYVHRGYTVLSSSGAVLQVVPPSMTEEERASLKAREPERVQALESEARREEDDRRLLAMYSSAADAQRACDRKIDALKLQMSVDKGNVARLQTELSNAEEVAANRERAGDVVPADMVDKIESLQRQVNVLKDAIRAREQDADEIRESYKSDIARMHYLIEHPEIVAALKSRDSTHR